MEMSKSDQNAQQMIIRNKKIIDLRRSGMELQDIANEIGLSKSRVGNILIAAGVVIRDRRSSGGSLNERIERIVPFVRNGMSVKEIAEHLQISVETVRKWYRPAEKIVQGERPSPAQLPAAKPKENHNARAALGEAALPVGHPIAVDAMWRGLEKYREPLAF